MNKYAAIRALHVEHTEGLHRGRDPASRALAALAARSDDTTRVLVLLAEDRQQRRRRHRFGARRPSASTASSGVAKFFLSAGLSPRGGKRQHNTSGPAVEDITRRIAQGCIDGVIVSVSVVHHGSRLMTAAAASSTTPGCAATAACAPRSLRPPPPPAIELRPRTARTVHRQLGAPIHRRCQKRPTPAPFLYRPPACVDARPPLASLAASRRPPPARRLRCDGASRHRASEFVSRRRVLPPACWLRRMRVRHRLGRTGVAAHASRGSVLWLGQRCFAHLPRTLVGFPRCVRSAVLASDWPPPRLIFPRC